MTSDCRIGRAINGDDGDNRGGRRKKEGMASEEMDCWWKVCSWLDDITIGERDVEWRKCYIQ